MSVSEHLDASSTKTTSPAPACSLAYLVSQYPTLSMSFVLREVLQLRALGFRIDTASINAPDRPPERLTEEERDEAAHTYCVKRHGLGGAAKAHLLALFRDFAGYCRGFGMVVRLGRLDLRRLAFNFFYFTEALMVGQWMRRKGQTHLHCHLGQQAATVGMYVRRIFSLGFSMTVHGPDEFYDARGQYLAEKIAAANFVVCISSFARSQLMMLSPYSHWNKILVSRLGVDPRIFSQQPIRTAPDTFDILCVGRLTPAKGQHVLIDAMERLKGAGRPVRLRLVGAGPDEASLREHAARIAVPDCVVFEGAVNQDRIRGFYQAADIFCIPSFAEGIPVVLMEAMAMGIPCVTTHITGVPELIRNGIDGLVVAPSDLDALTDALAKLMDDAALRQRISNSARERIAEHYDLHRNVEMLAAIFGERVSSV
jgi:glycosyltransferase involved in cell wall biosynthesis